MRGGILHGTPGLFFSSTLLWSCSSDVRRRTTSDGLVLNQFPSWSWVGWHGEFDTSLCTLSANYVRDDGLCSSGVTYRFLRHVSFYKCAMKPATKSTSPKRTLIADLHYFQKQSPGGVSGEQPDHFIRFVPLVRQFDVAKPR